MKERVSVTLDKETVKILNEILKKFRYRNRSHAVEEAIIKFAEKRKRER